VEEGAGDKPSDHLDLCQVIVAPRPLLADHVDAEVADDVAAHDQRVDGARNDAGALGIAPLRRRFRGQLVEAGENQGLAGDGACGAPRSGVQERWPS
jgi:hypothetical protein